MRLTGLSIAVLAWSLLAGSQSDKFAKYRAVEAHEIRPGILVLPRYSKEGKVCEVVLERQHYLDGIANVDSTIPRKVISQIVDELVPAEERGPITVGLGGAPPSAYSGNSVATVLDYQNIAVRIYGLSCSSSKGCDVVAVIYWKSRTCR